MKKVFLLIFVIVFSCFSLFASHLRLPALIGDHMVLQQQASVSVWGWAEAGAKVKLLTGWSPGNAETYADKDGKWELKLLTPEAGGPYEIEIQADTTIVLKDILIGEVWVCSGQSNMAMPFKGYTSSPVNGSNDYIAHGKNNNIRLFTVKKSYSIDPEENCIGKWSVSNPHDVSEFSAVAYVYGKYLQDVLGVPVGLIHSTWGGTPAQAWMDHSTLQNRFDEVDLSVLENEKVTVIYPTVLFNAMIHPLLKYCMRGVIWYQGESTINRRNPELYSKLFPGLIQNWRSRWGQGDFPFYFVQIAPYKYDSINSAYQREAQLIAMKNTINTGMAVTLDIGEYDNIHPAEKIIIGKRLAYWALARTYGIEGIGYCGPIYKEMSTKDNEVILTFDYAENGFSTFGKVLDGFTVAGEDKEFFPAEATIKGSKIIVSSERVPHPIAVRYCWENFVVGSLYNTSGLPASSFRTDNW